MRTLRTLATLVALLLVCSAFNRQCLAQQEADPRHETPAAIKVLEIGKVSDKAMKRTLENFAAVYDPVTPLYIINYGTDKEIARREKLIVSIGWRSPYDGPRITIVRGGLGKGANTVVWKVPYGADNPNP